jgi:2-methylisocitrate lyase-like PEP mutase family enzyme
VTPPDRLRALLAEPGFVVMPAVWDGLSAKMTFRAGFRTAFLSGSCVAAGRLGGPDLDLISFGEMSDSFNMVRGAAPELLVLADGDHGYGNAMNVQRTVRAYGRAGAAAILIEDKVTPRPLTSSGKPCLPREEARMKIRAAVEAAKESGILILARTDCRPTLGFEERRRASACMSRRAPTSSSSTARRMTPRSAARWRLRAAGPPSSCSRPAGRARRRARRRPLRSA